MANSPSESCSPLMEAVKENLFFQGFLRKRKDTMRFWKRYWFKLQNTTLYFYTDRESQATSLRGQYYMNTVQSVRTVSSADGDFTFEIVMKNGKRKLLSADSEDLREVWIQLLWKAMQLPGPGRHNSSCTWYDIPELLQRVSNSSADEQLSAVSPDSDLKDDVFHEAAGSDSKSSSDDEGNVPKQHHVALSPDAVDNGGNCSDSIYDFPRPQTRLDAPQPEHTDAEEYMTMDQLSLYDTPKPSALRAGVSGAAPPVCVSNSAAKKTTA